MLKFVLVNLNYRNDVHMNFAQSRIPALVCSPQSEYGCHKAGSKGHQLVSISFCQFYKKVVLRLTVEWTWWCRRKQWGLSPPKFLSKLGPWHCLFIFRANKTIHRNYTKQYTYIIILEWCGRASTREKSLRDDRVSRTLASLGEGVDSSRNSVDVSQSEDKILRSHSHHFTTSPKQRCRPTLFALEINSGIENIE